jgi:predicted small secreted protein
MKRSTGILSLLVACTFLLAACAEQTGDQGAGMDTTTATTQTDTMDGDMAQPGMMGDGPEATPQATLSALEGGVRQMPVSAAVSNINGWQKKLRNSDAQGASQIVSTLGELKNALQQSQIDGQRVGDLLSQLGEQTTQAADNVQGQQATQLKQLGSTLSKAGSQLTGGGM